MLTIIQIVLPVFIVLAVGYAVKRAGLIDDAFIRTANRLIFNLCLPVLLYYKISLADLSSVFNALHVGVMYISIMVIFLVSFLLNRPLKLGHSAGTFAIDSFRANFAYMGLPVSAYAFGDEGLVTASVLMAFVVPLANLLSVVALAISSHAGKSLKPLIRTALFNPLAAACVAGLLTSWSGIHFPDFFSRSLDIVSGVTLPLALFSVGGTISIEKLKGDMFRASLSAVLKLIIMPLTAFAVFTALGTQIGIPEKTVIIMMSAPAATVNYVLAATMDGDPSLAGSSIVLSTLLSVLTFTLWLFVLGV
ncbi:MAG: AEC family transporter [Deferribacterales bacterium]